MADDYITLRVPVWRRRDLARLLEFLLTGEVAVDSYPEGDSLDKRAEDLHVMTEDAQTMLRDLLIQLDT